MGSTELFALGAIVTGFTDWLSDFFSAADYFTGDFMEDVANGFMK